MTNQLQRGLKYSIAFVMLYIAASGMASRCHAETIMKMTLDASATGNMELLDGVFSILGLSNTPDSLNMSIDYVIGAPQAFSADIPGGAASVTLGGMTASAPAYNNGAFIMQTLNSGSLVVFDVNQQLLLSAELIKSGLQGALGPGDKQGLFLGFGTVTGGSLKPLLDPDSLQVRIKFPTISNGFSVSAPPPNSYLIDFKTWTPSIEIMATPVVVPEPSITLLLCALAGTLVPRRRRRCA